MNYLSIISDKVSKILVQFIILILNYIFSKFIVFVKPSLKRKKIIFNKPIDEGILFIHFNKYRQRMCKEGR